MNKNNSQDSLLSQKEHAALAEAIRAAEAQTAGEIFVAITRQSDDYRFIPVLWAAITAIAGGALATFIYPRMPASTLVIQQLLAFLMLSALTLIDQLRPYLIPRFIKYQRAHRHAIEQFLAHNLHATTHRTGVLIFISMDERYAEIIADKGINDKVSPETWTVLVDSLTATIRSEGIAAGINNAISDVGAILAQYFPPNEHSENELPNAVVEL